MNDLFEEAKAIVRGEVARPSEAYRRLVDGLLYEGADIALSDRDLVLAALHACRLDKAGTAIVALDELSLRMANDETREQAERRVA